jgi:hypothetical protein
MMNGMIDIFNKHFVSKLCGLYEYINGIALQASKSR